MNKILISGCLLGELVRYDGKSKPITNPIITQWYQQNRLISICPEVAGGLSIPRPPAEKQANNQIVTEHGINVTEQFNTGAQQALELCNKHNIKVAILKQGSPSCGSTTIYDGTFSGNKISGEGLTCQLLRQHGIKVFCENTLDQAALFAGS